MTTIVKFNCGCIGTNTKPGKSPPRLVSRPGIWYLHINNDIPILTTYCVRNPLVKGEWADVYPAYKRYALMLMKE